MIQVRSFFMLLLLFCLTDSYGQNVGDNVGVEDSQKPNGAKSQGGDGLVSVDPYTGTGSVNIPIHDYNEDGINLGVSISYTTKGIKLNEVASPIGLGFNLNAGGQITREVHGIEDEVTLPCQFYWGTTSGVPNLTAGIYGNDFDTLQGILSPGVINTWNQPVGNGVYDDQESDLFNVSLCGRSISFAFKLNAPLYTYQTYPKSEIKIELVTEDLAGGSYTNIRSGVQKNVGIKKDTNILGFIITDEAGNVFYFNRGDVEKKVYELDNHQFYPATGTYYAVQSWVLTKVVTYSGDQIDYTYESTYLKYQQNRTEVLTNSMAFYNSTTHAWEDDPLELKDIYWEGYKSHLSKIDYHNGVSVLFDISHAADARCDCQGDFVLHNIIIEDRYNDTLKNSIRYRLNHGYFNSPVTGFTSYELPYSSSCDIVMQGLSYQLRSYHGKKGLRLKLNSIERVGMDTATTEPMYSFEYNQTPLPYRFTPSIDYYGYYNGKTPVPFTRAAIAGGTDYFYLSIPYHTDPEDDHSNINDTTAPWGLNRADDFNYIQALTLTKIKNGTGGETKIEYKDYQLVNPDCSYYAHYPYGNAVDCDIDPEMEGDTVNDGLCVWKITTSNRFSTEYTTTDEYSFKGGKRFYRGGYCWYPVEVDASGGYIRVYTNYFVSPNDYVNGSNHGFDTAIVTRTGYNGERLSKTKYTFSNLMYYNDTGLVSCISRPTGPTYHTLPAKIKKYRMGLPLKIESYDELDNLVSKQENTYEYVSDPLVVSSYKVFKDLTGGSIWEYNTVDHESMRKSATSITRYVKDPAYGSPKTLVTSYNYLYDDKDNVKRIQWTDSKGDTYKKWRYYNYDYYAKYPTITVLATMNTRSMQHLLSNEVWKVAGADSVLTSFDLLVPGFGGSNLRFPAAFASAISAPLSSASVYPSVGQSPSINRRNALDYTNYSSYGTNLKKAQEFTGYDYGNNVTETEYNELEIYDCSILDEFGQKIAQAKNARVSQIAYTSFEPASYLAAGFPILDPNKGNWNFDPLKILRYNAVPCDKALMGNYVYNMRGGGSLYSKDLGAGDYQVTFWAMGADTPVVRLVDNVSNMVYFCRLLNTVGPWKLYQAAVTVTGTPVHEYVAIEVPGSSPSYVDEVRLYPAEATMVTSNYEPLKGVISVSDASNYINYFEYDKQGRLTVTRDMRGNMTSRTEKVINGESTY